jgi:NAD(P)-dependent dehydrogenase (short-subunit alcohol dehydrogenase family)
VSQRPVVVVTGGGGGIGAAVAEELGRQGSHVVTLDPLVTLDGSAPLPPPEETTAGRIVAAGGSAQGSSASVTDAEGVRRLFEELVAEHGRLNGVVNVAGISRPTSFAGGHDDDWRTVLAVHLDGYLNVLGAALPIMAAAGHGRVLGVTSGSGWRAADTGAYGCAKRAVASLTWLLGRGAAPAGVTVNAMSPIAVTRMVTAALGQATARSSSATGGLSLGSMPEPRDLGPLGAHLVGTSFDWCTGEVVFAGGSEVAIVEPPALLEVVRTGGVGSLPHLLEAVVPGALARAEAAQASGGGGNPRFGPAFSDTTGDLAGPAIRTATVVSDRPGWAAAATAALQARGIAVTAVGGDTAPSPEAIGTADAVVVALAEPDPAGGGAAWERLLAEHAGLAGRIHTDARWARAASDAGRPLRLVTLTDGRTGGGRSRGQSAAHHSRMSRTATDDRVAAFAVAVEADDADVAAELAAHLVAHPEAPALSGAELVVGDGWLGVRSHPRPRGSIVLGQPTVPGWLDDTLRSIVGRPAP